MRINPMTVFTVMVFQDDLASANMEVIITNGVKKNEKD